MGKRTKDEVEKASAASASAGIAAKKQKKEKKHKGKEAESTAAPAASFSLFSGKATSDLDDIFSKGASYAVAAQPVAGPSKGVSFAEVEEGSDEDEDDVEDEEDEDDEDDEEEEDAELDAADASESDESSDEDDAEVDPATLVHEALKPSTSRANEPSASKKYVPVDESPQDRDRRTIFVGNLPIEVAQKKSALSQLRAHLLTFVPGAKIESTRFRSVPFATPTAALPEDPDAADAEGVKRQKREKERAKAWREQQDILERGEEREKEEVDTSKSFIDTKGKRKVAFIKKDFHAEGASCNAYVVFAHAQPDRPANLPPIMNPYEAAEAAIKADGSNFNGRTIRVDSARPSANPAANGGRVKREEWTKGHDPKCSVFVGGLDYATKDEDLRVFFEGKVKAERGAKADGGNWVVGVRIIRDKETQMGKGFGYIHLADTESVDEVLGLDESKLKFARRQLRLQRSKALPPVNKQKAAAAAAAGNAKAGPGSKAGAGAKKSIKVRTIPSGPIPKGNPALGEKLKDLPKDERKAAKAQDDERQARRLAKKAMKVKSNKLKGEMEKGAVKLTATKGEKSLRGKKHQPAKKSRVRSGNALAKMKGSRT